MDVNSIRFSISPTRRFFILFLVLFDLQKSSVVATHAPGINDEVLCTVDMSAFLPLPYGKLPNMVCKRLWDTFVLRYSRTEGNVVTIVLSTVYTTGWVGIGFSKDGMMLNSGCMVGWVNLEGRARIEQYFVEGLTTSDVKPDKGNLDDSELSGTFHRVDDTKKTHGVLTLVGLSIDHKLRAHDIAGHRTIGIFVLVLSILQVMAFFARPSKDSKNRKYWNWYHSWCGRTAIFLAAINIILGIHIGDARPGWKIGYGILLGMTLIACILLEALSRLKISDDREFPPAFQNNCI
ncbi:hypothetical protein ACH5RR_024196 [Cinchona calisaya]|uniref:Uncharacterized protein n=1 Tax=Cinchona calisaya TaxID=153742 RepID=A0ABD2ZDW8_9GENT